MMKNQTSIIQILVVLPIITLFLLGCQTKELEGSIEEPEGSPEESLTTPVPGFTYATRTGGIWQVDLNGDKMQLLPNDGVEKKFLKWSPNRRWLAYVIREWPQTDGEETSPVQESLIVAEANMANSRRLAGPVRAINIKWLDDHTIKLWLTDKLSDGGEPQQWDKFLLDVDTGKKTEIKQEEGLPTPNFSSPDGRWAFAFEKESDKRYAYLLDAGGNKIDTIYERPTDQGWPLVWSPDSRYILYYSTLRNEDVYVYDLTTREGTNITNFPKGQDNSISVIGVSWSPTGEWALLRLRTNKRINEPCLVHVPEGRLQCFDISPWSGRFVWSVDGRYLGFIASQGDGQREVYAIDTIQGKLLNLTQDAGEISEIAP